MKHRVYVCFEADHHESTSLASSVSAVSQYLTSNQNYSMISAGKPVIVAAMVIPDAPPAPAPSLAEAVSTFNRG